MILSKNQAVAIKPIIGIEFRYNNKLLYIGLLKRFQVLPKNRFNQA
jgi:DNA polymerase-3 subunit alpha/error-prone DNA polymerase